MRKLFNILIIVLACLSVQGCLRSYFEQKESERKAEKNKVPETKARFHINDTEYYREDNVSILSRRNDFFIRKWSDPNVVSACLRSVGKDNTKGDISMKLALYIPKSMFYQGSSIRDEGGILYYYGNKRCDGFDADGKNNRSAAHLLRGDYLDISIPKLDGFEIGDSVRINFAFKLSFIDWKVIDGVETDCGVIETYVCEDGIFKEVIRNWTVLE